MNAVSIVSLCFSGVMLLISLVNLIVSRLRDTKKDTSDGVREISSLREGIIKANMKLDQVCATTNDIKTDIKAMDKKLAEHGEEIAVLKRDLKTAFVRIDEIREEIAK